VKALESARLLRDANNDIDDLILILDLDLDLDLIKFILI
jgi:hypothetical protein